METLINVCVILLIMLFSAVSIIIVLAGTTCRKSIGHDIFGWHDCKIDDPDAKIKTGICKYCGKKCEMDWDGNWNIADNSGGIGS